MNKPLGRGYRNTKENNMYKLIQALQGKKTYIISALMVLATVGVVAGNLALFLKGKMSWHDFVNDPSTQLLLTGFGTAAMRAGVSKTK